MRFTLEEKLRYVKLHLEENVPIYEIEKKYGLRAENLKYFCRLYKRHGERAFQKEEGKRIKYTKEVKLKAIKEHIQEGKSFREIGVELMLTDSNIVGDWLNKYKIGGEVLEDLERTKAENEYLKKSFPQVLKRSKQIKKKH